MWVLWFLIIVFWSWIGGCVYFKEFDAASHATFPQRLFVAILCGPLAWLAIVYEMLGWVGK